MSNDVLVVLLESVKSRCDTDMLWEAYKRFYDSCHYTQNRLALALDIPECAILSNFVLYAAECCFNGLRMSAFTLSYAKSSDMIFWNRTPITAKILYMTTLFDMLRKTVFRQHTLVSEGCSLKVRLGALPWVHKRSLKTLLLVNNRHKYASGRLLLELVSPYIVEAALRDFAPRARRCARLLKHYEEVLDKDNIHPNPQSARNSIRKNESLMTTFVELQRENFRRGYVLSDPDELYPATIKESVLHQIDYYLLFSFVEGNKIGYFCHEPYIKE